MPDFFTHMAFSKRVSKEINIQDLNRFLVSSLIPDVCRLDEDINKEKCHFIGKRFSKTFKNPNILSFFVSYKELFDDEATLGIYSHLYLDKYYYIDFLPSVFDFNGEYMINKKTGKKFITWEEFFVPNGVYREYTAINKFWARDYDLDIENLDFELANLPDIKEFDYSKLLPSRQKMLNFYHKEEEYTEGYIDYEELRAFINELADKFVRHLLEL